jgi:hypothetical protein
MPKQTEIIPKHKQLLIMFIEEKRPIDEISFKLGYQYFTTRDILHKYKRAHNLTSLEELQYLPLEKALTKVRQ